MKYLILSTLIIFSGCSAEVMSARDQAAAIKECEDHNLTFRVHRHVFINSYQVAAITCQPKGI